jgi:ureidoglycolate lyase
LPVIDATADTVKPFGKLFTEGVEQQIDIPFYRGRVIEGGDIGFLYRDQAAVRTAQVLPVDTPDVAWLERHMHLTQLFVALGSGGSFVMVLAPPDPDSALPDLGRAQALRFPPGCALLLHLGTWHDFPIAVDQQVTLLIANSAEVVDALASAGRPRELDQGDTYKISLPDRFGVCLRPAL